MPRSRFSVMEARRIALAAQGFDRERPTNAANAGHIKRVVTRLGLLQLDFVNVLVPAHQLIAYSRLGAYPFVAFERAMYESGEFTEQWAHEASIVPVSSWPLLAHRRDAYRQSPHSPLFLRQDHRRYLADVLALVRERGALTASDLPQVAGPKRKAGDWHRSVPRWALEHHFGRGELAVSRRLGNFQRVYDLPERVIGTSHREQSLDKHEAQRRLLAQAARALGIASSHDLADYFRMKLTECKPRLDELREQGCIESVQVDGWNADVWLYRGTRLPRAIRTSALLSPFDPLVWYRPRAERLFDFHYRIEIYVPESKRRWGYYVLPFLCDERIVARVDLKADRGEGSLRVRAAFAERGIDVAAAADRLAGELRQLANWLGLESIRVDRKGDLAVPLGKAVRASV